ncbi:MAG: helix-turn-helix transcriptional regulator [Saprospiraceae bacterium]|nr:helix-turn-helix transcriptional regulator [Saprospiraceae bacterium]
MNFFDAQLIRYKNKEVFFHMTFRSPACMEDHMYDAPCFIYALNAEGSVSSSAGQTPVQQEEGALMRCGSYINSWSAVQPDGKVEIIVIKLIADLVLKIFSEINFDPRKSIHKPLLTIKAQQNMLLQRYMESLLFYFRNPIIVTDDLAYLKLKELVLLLLQLPDQTVVKSTLLHLFRQEQFTVFQIVENHLFDNFTTGQLAHFAHMSKATFRRKFKQHSKLPVQKYILNRRLEKAESLLKTKHRSVAEIAADCAFSDSNYFSKVFKQKYGKTPRAYRLAEQLK